MRLAQLVVALGGSLEGLERVPDAVAAALERDLDIEPPPRLLEFTGAGPNQWTAAEGALKVRETSRVATEGLSVEQFFHGPSVAVDERDSQARRSRVHVELPWREHAHMCPLPNAGADGGARFEDERPQLARQRMRSGS